MVPAVPRRAYKCVGRCETPDLASSDFHIFPTLKRTLKGHCFTTNEDVEAAVQTQDTDFTNRGEYVEK
jgi:hypothetical protein